MRQAAALAKWAAAGMAAVLCHAPVASATSVAPRTLEEIATEADHVLVGTVVRVDMIDHRGRPLLDPGARTGPGLDNTIRFLLDVEEVLFSTCRMPPRRVLIPLWQAWHYALGDMQSVEGSRGIFLLQGKNFAPAYPADFQRALSERAALEPVLAALHDAHDGETIPCRDAPAR